MVFTVNAEAKSTVLPKRGKVIEFPDNLDLNQQYQREVYLHLRHFFDQIEKIIGRPCPFIFRQINENGNKNYLFHILPETARKLELSSNQFKDTCPWMIHAQLVPQLHEFITSTKEKREKPPALESLNEKERKRYEIVADAIEVMLQKASQKIGRKGNCRFQMSRDKATGKWKFSIAPRLAKRIGLSFSEKENDVLMNLYLEIFKELDAFIRDKQ